MVADIDSDVDLDIDVGEGVDADVKVDVILNSGCFPPTESLLLFLSLSMRSQQTYFY